MASKMGALGVYEESFASVAGLGAGRKVLENRDTPENPKPSVSRVGKVIPGMWAWVCSVEYLLWRKTLVSTHVHRKTAFYSFEILGELKTRQITFKSTNIWGMILSTEYKCLFFLLISDFITLSVWFSAIALGSSQEEVTNIEQPMISAIPKLSLIKRNLKMDGINLREGVVNSRIKSANSLFPYPGNVNCRIRWADKRCRKTTLFKRRAIWAPSLLRIKLWQLDYAANASLLIDHFSSR